MAYGHGPRTTEDGNVSSTTSSSRFEYCTYVLRSAFVAPRCGRERARGAESETPLAGRRVGHRVRLRGPLRAGERRGRPRRPRARRHVPRGGLQPELRAVSREPCAGLRLSVSQSVVEDHRPEPRATGSSRLQRFRHCGDGWLLAALILMLQIAQRMMHFSVRTTTASCARD